MKRLTTILVLGFALLLSFTPASAAKKEKVFPTGDPGLDAAAVQEAVNRASSSGGAVLLKARNRQGVPMAFDFGEDGQVVITGPGGNIKILGESGDDDDDDEDGYAQTAIVGGNIPILMQRRAHLTVRNIEFSGAFLHAIFVQAATGVKIKNNVFLDTVGFPSFFNPPGCDTDPTVDCVGIFPLTRVIYLEGPFLDPDQITGKVVISGNIIDTATGGFTDGITSFFTNADIRIEKNQISGVNVAIRMDEFGKPMKIADNYLSADVPAPGFVAAGALVSCGAGVPIDISDNHVNVTDDTGPAGFGIGMSVFAFNLTPGGCNLDGLSLRDNDITLSNAAVGIDLGADDFFSGPQRFVNNIIADNAVRGSAFFGGISLEGFGSDLELSGNRFVNNDVSGLDADVDVSFAANTNDNTAFVAPGTNVLDFGVNNQIIIVFDDDEFLSRLHMEIGWSEGRAQLRDLDSYNGCFVRLREPRV